MLTTRGFVVNRKNLTEMSFNQYSFFHSFSLSEIPPHDSSVFSLLTSNQFMYSIGATLKLFPTH